ncbi:MAG: hypothetical protein JW955_08310 [Sedimentisphaerales bacterium]|nr:hypothetical protein [Sedimentisphaerales bacterium]
MNRDRTHLQRGSRVGGRRVQAHSGPCRWVVRLLTIVQPRFGLCVVGLVGLVALFSSARVCAAAESGGAATAPGIRDPLNPQAYMQELAAKLHPSTDRSVLLRGLTPPDNSSSSGSQSPGTSALAGRPAEGSSSSLVTAQVVPPGTDMRAGKTAEKDTSAATRPMSFWDHPSLNRPAEPDRGTAPDAANDLRRSASAVPMGRPEAQTTPIEWQEEILGPMGVTLATMKPGVTLASSPELMPSPQQTPANLAARVTIEDRFQVAMGETEPDERAETRWSPIEDLDKYRAHAVKEGARGSDQNIKKAFERAGLTLEDGVNVFVLGYASPRGEPFRKNDGKGLLDEPGKVPEQAGETIASAGLGLYSVADLILLNSLGDPDAAVYRDNHPVVRPLVFTGRLISGVWKTTQEAGNALTWGYFDNITGCIGMCIEDIIELLKHAGEAVTNLVRAPVRLAAGENEELERAMDWVLLVPLEFVTNATEMKGIANMEDYKAAFEDKGVIGSIVELGGSTFLVYRGTKELIDRFEHKHHRKHQATAGKTASDATTPDTPPPTPPDQVFLLNGDWPIEGTNTSGVVSIDGAWTTITTWRE